MNQLKRILPLAIVLGIFGHSLVATSSLSPTSAIPHGHMAGRPQAKYGTYGTPVGEAARPFQDRLEELQNKAYGLSLLSSEKPVIQAELTYLLENEILGLHQEIANAPDSVLTAFERGALLFANVRAYQDVRHHSERLYENMIRYIDHKIPGPNGQQLRVDNLDGLDSAYFPNYRSDKNLTEAEKSRFYQKRLHEFEDEGGSLSEIQLLNADLAKTFPAYSRFEYVWLINGEVRITSGKAGHVLLAEGKAVRGAGQIVLLKNYSGRFTLAIVSNASGSYKPDLVSAEHLLTRLSTEFAIPKGLTVVTKGEPVSTQGVKIYLKADGIDPVLIKKKMKDLEAQGFELLTPPPSNAECAAVFSAA